MTGPRFSLDSWAVLRYLEGQGPAARQVRRVLRSERPYMSWINLGEVHYVLLRKVGEPGATRALSELRRQVTLDAATPERVIAAARIKATNRMSFADAFAVATAEAHGVTLLTGDPEIADGRRSRNVEDISDG